MGELDPTEYNKCEPSPLSPGHCLVLVCLEQLLMQQYQHPPGGRSCSFVEGASI